MISWMKKAATQASVVRRNESPCLFVSFATSSPPLLWQFDLEKMSNHVICLREKEGEWDLGLTLPQGVFTAVAHFDERGDAEAAYAAVQAALVRGERPQVAGAARWALGIAAALFLVLFVADRLAGVALQQAEAAKKALDASVEDASSLHRTPADSGPKEIQTGVPVSADDVLQAPPED